MYLVGAEHPHKVDARRILERAIGAGERLVTAAEVLQEILHRYVAVLQARGIERIATFDRRFDEVPGLERVSV